MGNLFPKGKALFECEGAAISNPLAVEQGHMTPKNAPGDSKLGHRLTELQFDARAGKQPPVGFDERTTRR